MSAMLLVPFPPAGHAEPMAALADRLRADGHRVTVFAQTDTTRWGLDRPLPPEMYTSADGGTLFRHLFLGDVVDMVHDIRGLARESGAEVIVSDVMMPGGGLVAELTGLPWASLSCCPVPSLDAYRTFLPDHAIGAFSSSSTLAELGLPADDRNLLGRTSARLHLILTTPLLADFPRLPTEVALVGPFATGPLEDAAPAGNTVVVTASTHSLASLGSRAMVQDRYLTAAVDALAELDVTGLVTAASGTRQPPDNVRFLGRVGHDVLFDRAIAVVTHSGWGTVARALVRGLPLVLVPIAGDQPYVARRCADLGLGIALDADTVTAERIRDAVHEVMTEPRYRKAAAEMAVHLRGADPLTTAASLITSLLGSEG